MPALRRIVTVTQVVGGVQEPVRVARCLSCGRLLLRSHRARGELELVCRCGERVVVKGDERGLSIRAGELGPSRDILP